MDTDTKHRLTITLVRTLTLNIENNLGVDTDANRLAITLLWTQTLNIDWQ